MWPIHAQGKNFRMKGFNVENNFFMFGLQKVSNNRQKKVWDKSLLRNKRGHKEHVFKWPEFEVVEVIDT